MNEQDFRNALRQTMAVSTAPPPMRDDEVLDAARRDRKRRRAMWAGGGSAVAVAAIAVGVVVLAPSGSGGGVDVGGQPPEVHSTQEPPQATGSAQESKTSWPNGQTDRTATAGPQFDRGVALATALNAVVPAGYESPDDPQLKYNQANYDDTVNGTELWSYTAIAPVAKGTGIGKLIVEVKTPRPEITGEGCALTAKFWGIKGDCTEVAVGGKKVAVVTPASGNDQADQWAGFRHDDGTVVFVAQAALYGGEGMQPLDAPPLTADQLAALAADPRFNLD
jgi:hypothetical protein